MEYLVAAGGLLDFANSKLNAFQGTLQLGMVVVGVCMVIATYVKSKAMVPTLGAIMLAALAIFSAHAPTWLSDKVGEEAKTSQVAPAQNGK